MSSRDERLLRAVEFLRNLPDAELRAMFVSLETDLTLVEEDIGLELLEEEYADKMRARFDAYRVELERRGQIVDGILSED